jgi:hypothetical protein
VIAPPPSAHPASVDTTKPKNLAFIVHGPTGEYYNKESGFVIKSEKKRVVVGRLRGGVITPLKESDIPDLKMYRFPHEMPSGSPEAPATATHSLTATGEFDRPKSAGVLVKKDVANPRQSGLTVFDVASKPFSLGLPTTPTMKKKIGEANDVVNVLASAVSAMIDRKEEDDGGHRFVEAEDQDSDEEILEEED